MLVLKYHDGSALTISQGKLVSDRIPSGEPELDAAFDGLESFLLAYVQECRLPNDIDPVKLQAALTTSEDAIYNHFDV